MAKRIEFNPLRYGLNTRYNRGFWRYNDGRVIIKADCGSESRLSVTQKDRKKKQDCTISIQDQYALIAADDKTVAVFSCHPRVPPPEGFYLLGALRLVENIHTLSSYNKAIEWCFLFGRDSDDRSFTSFKEEVEDIGRLRRPRNVDKSFLRKVENNPRLRMTKSITENQQAIVDYNRRMYINTDDDVLLVNGNGSIKFLNNGRKPNGKIQSMAGPTIITRHAAYKMTTEGVCRFRDIPMPPRGYDSRQTVNHTVHPDLLQIIIRNIS